MKFILNLSLFLLAFFLFSNAAFSLTNYQIKRYCAKQEKVFSCIKELKEKRSNLEKGNRIEIPVFPFKN